MARTAWQAAVEALEAEGVRYAFGLSGNPLHLVADLDGSSVTPILARNESSAVFMAYGYARVSREVGVCFGNPGPGTTEHGLGHARGRLGVRAGRRALQRHRLALRRGGRAAGARRHDAHAPGDQVVVAAARPGRHAVAHAARLPRRPQRAPGVGVRRGARRPRPARGRDRGLRESPAPGCAPARRATRSRPSPRCWRRRSVRSSSPARAPGRPTPAPRCARWPRRSAPAC